MKTKTKVNGKKLSRRRVPAPDPRELLLWWARAAGVLEDLVRVCGRILDEERRGGPTFRGMFDRVDLRELYNQVADAACQWGAAAPSIPSATPDPLAALGFGKGVKS